MIKLLINVFIIFDVVSGNKQPGSNPGQPVFLSQPGQFTVVEGEPAFLPCQVDNSGSYPLVWRRGTRVLSAGNIITAVDSRFHLGGSSAPGRQSRGHGEPSRGLWIDPVRANDTGRYVCAVSTDPVQELTHSLTVVYGPIVEILPHSEEVLVNEGESLQLECKASGVPTPTVRWRAKKRSLDGASDVSTTVSVAAALLRVTSLTRSAAGVYECLAENSRGTRVSQQVTVRVQHAPLVTAPAATVHSGSGHDARLVCHVTAFPAAQVIWSRQKSGSLSSRYQESMDEGDDGVIAHTLLIQQVQDSDLDTYTCQASNKHGLAKSRVLLTGVASMVEITSDPLGHSPHSFDLSWSVVSQSRILEYKVAYRVDQSVEERVLNGNRSDHSGAWHEIMVPTSGALAVDSRALYTHTIHLKSLEAHTQYRAYVQARNRYGWNAASSVFRFSTLARGAAMESRTSARSSAPSISSQTAPASLLASLLTSCYLMVLTVHRYITA